MGVISGIVKESGTPVAGRIVRAYRRDTGAMLGEVVSSDGLPVPGDANLSARVLLIKGDEAIVDDGPGIRAVTANGSAAIEADAAAFGGKAIRLNGGGSYLTLDGHSSLALGTGAFTIEMRVRLLSLTTNMALIDFRPASTNGAFPLLYVSSGGVLSLYVNSAEQISGAHSLNTSAYGHVAYCRGNDGIGRLFCNGALIGSWADTLNYSVGAARPIIGALGYNPNEASFGRNMFVQAIRVSNRAEYTGPFTPPTSQFYANAPAAAAPLGSYSISTSHAGEVQVVCLDDGAGTTHNDLIVRTVPV